MKTIEITGSAKQTVPLFDLLFREGQGHAPPTCHGQGALPAISLDLHLLQLDGIFDLGRIHWIHNAGAYVSTDEEEISLENHTPSAGKIAAAQTDCGTLRRDAKLKIH